MFIYTNIKYRWFGGSECASTPSPNGPHVVAEHYGLKTAALGQVISPHHRQTNLPLILVPLHSNSETKALARVSRVPTRKALRPVMLPSD